MSLILVCILLFSVVSEAQIIEAPYTGQNAKCEDHHYPSCYNKNMYCGGSCPYGCTIDCQACVPICLPRSAWPPEPALSPSGSVEYPSPDLFSPPYSHTEAPPYPFKQMTASCDNKAYPQCYRLELNCPSLCINHCVVDCVTCSPRCPCMGPGAVCQDPKFIGADGITFYFHGKKDKDFCILSDSNLHINAHFIGKRNENMKRDFTWVQSLGILFNDHKLYIGAKKTSTWDDVVDRLIITFDGESIPLPEGEGSKWKPMKTAGVSITRSRDTNSVILEVLGNFQIKATVVPITEKESQIHNYGITNEDCFAHLDLSFKFYALSGEVNGVLGQTYARNYVSKVKMGIEMPVLGGEKEFVSSNLFSTDCVKSRFNGTNSNASENFEFANLKCVSGLHGRGIVCKR